MTTDIINLTDAELCALSANCDETQLGALLREASRRMGDGPREKTSSPYFEKAMERGIAEHDAMQARIVDLEAQLASARKDARGEALVDGAAMASPITKALHEVTADRDAQRAKVAELDRHVEWLGSTTSKHAAQWRDWAKRLVGQEDLDNEGLRQAIEATWPGPGKKLDGWAPTILTRVTRHGAMVVTIDEDQATVMFRRQVEGACIEHEILSDAGETSMSVAEAIRVSDELVEDLDAGRMFDGSYGRRA